MKNYTTVVGLDVHKLSIVAAILRPGNDRAIERMTIENQPKAIENMVRRLTAQGPAEFVYEAGPCGYQLQRQMSALGQAGELTEVHVPSLEQEAARDLVRTREDILSDQTRARHRLGKFLLRQGLSYGGTRTWSTRYQAWLQGLSFQWEPTRQSFEAYVRAAEEAQGRRQAVEQQMADLAQKEPYQTQVRYLSCLRGVDRLTALTLAVEAQEFRRFEKAVGFMSYTGMVPSEYSSGQSVRRGSITKVGNAHIRRVLVEAAWHYRRNQAISLTVDRRREGCPPEVVEIAKKASRRLHRKFSRMIGKGKLPQVATVAVARELAGFVWSIARQFPAEAAA